MAITLNNNLYPPLVDTYMPAFDKRKSCRIYFSLPEMLSLKNLNQYVQISVVNQQTNANVLNVSQYPGGIKRQLFFVESNEDDDTNNYYVELSPSDLVGTYIGVKYSGNTGMISTQAKATRNQDSTVTIVFTGSISSSKSNMNPVRVNLTTTTNQITLCSFVYGANGKLNWQYECNNEYIKDKLIGQPIYNGDTVTLNFTDIPSIGYYTEIISDTTPTKIIGEGENNLRILDLTNNTVTSKQSSPVEFFDSNSITLINQCQVCYASQIQESIDAIFNKEFNCDTYYKVQLRFEGKDTVIPQKLATLGWIESQKENFSEWSTVCLLKALTPPVLSIPQLETGIVRNQIINLNAAVEFDSDAKDTEYVYKYRVRLKQFANELYNSGWMVSNTFQRNQIIDTIEYLLFNSNNWKYTLYIDIETNNFYTKTFSYPFEVKIDTNLKSPFKDFYAESDNDNGSVKLTFKLKRTKEAYEDLGLTLEEDKETGKNPYLDKYYIIRRASNESDFNYWEEIKRFYIPQNSVLQFTYRDKTVESGVLYQYKIQMYDKTLDSYSQLYDAKHYDSDANDFVLPCVHEEKETAAEPYIIPYLDDIFLVGDNKILPIKFNPSVESISYNLPENSYTTLGSKFPYVVRAGKSNYRSFQISGTISAQMDEEHIFTNKYEILDNYRYEYKKFKEKKNISNKYDYIFERKFREKVLEFLTDGKVKLYKSTQEGNILVQLMNVTMTPNKELGRLIYDFSCNAVEVDENNIFNIDKYEVQPINSELVSIICVPVVDYDRTNLIAEIINDYFTTPNMDNVANHYALESREILIEKEDFPRRMITTLTNRDIYKV